MKVISLKIKHFLGIGEAAVSFDDKGLIAVQGVNLDDTSATSNGASKSTIMEALFWCLYGSTTRGLSGDDVIHWDKQKGCVVEAEIDDDGSRGVITRWRKSSGYSKRSGVQIIVDDIDLTKGKDSLTQEEINRFVGSSSDVFLAAVYQAQEEMPDLPKMTDAMLKTVIEEAAGIRELEKAGTIARERVRSAEAAFKTFMDGIEALESDRDRVQTEIYKTNERYQTWSRKLSERIAALSSDIKSDMQRAQTVADEVASFDPSKNEAREAEILAETGKLRTEHDGLDKRLSELSHEQDGLRERQDIVAKANSKFEKMAYVENNLKRDLMGFESKLAGVEKRVGEPCGECGKPITSEDVSEVETRLREKVSELQTSVKIAGEDVVKAKTVFDKAMKMKDDFEAGMTDTSQILSEMSALRDKISGLDRELHEVRRASGETQRKSDSIQAIKDAAKTKAKTLSELKLETNPHEAQLTELKADLERIQKEHGDRVDQLTAEHKKVSIAKGAAEVFSVKGARARVLDTVTPMLNERTSEYLSHLSDGGLQAVWSTLSTKRDGELTEKFSIDVTRDGKGSFKGLSGGQKRKVRLACALALQDLVASRAAKPIELWIGDEIDQALDPAGLERLMTLLEHKARERGTVVVISHTDLKDWCREVMTVTMKNGEASVSGSGTL